MSDLLLCPWCGATGEAKVHVSSNIGITDHWVECPRECTAPGPTHATAELAAAWWNHRHAEGGLTAALEAIHKAADEGSMDPALFRVQIRSFARNALTAAATPRAGMRGAANE